FASVLIAVILRFIGEILSVRAGMTSSWSLVVGGSAVLGLIAVVVTLFGTQLAGQFNALTSQLQKVERTVAGYFDVSSAKDLLSGSSVGSLLARARFLASFGESLQVVTSPCCPRQLPDVIPENFPWMLDPVPRRYTMCSRLFPSTASSAFPKEKVGSASRV